MANRKDITGETFGYLTAIEYDHFDGKNSYWKFRCKCGNNVVRSLKKLKRAKTPSCGCYMKEIMENAEIKRKENTVNPHCNAKRNRNLESETFGNLSVLRLLSEHPGIEAEYICKCNCGNTVIKKQKYLINQSNKLSCGCDRKNVSVGFGSASRKRLYGIYKNMINRCYNEKNPSYKYYGGKGVTVNKYWLGDGGFDKFCQWSFKNGYSDELTIDRINPNGNYTPENCRWADYETQANNKTNNIHIEFLGEIMGLNDFCKKTGVSYSKAHFIIQNDCIFSGSHIVNKINK